MRSTNLNGPVHTGLAPKFAPAACAAFGETIMPARSASTASNGENGAARFSRTVFASTTSTLVTGAQLAAAVGARHRLVALDVELDGRGVELLAVVEGDARAQVQRQRLAVGRPFVARRELRHDVELLVDVEQLVAQRCEHDAADEGARERRVEHVGVFGEADTQRLRRRGQRHGCQQQPAATGIDERRSCEASPDRLRTFTGLQRRRSARRRIAVARGG